MPHAFPPPRARGGVRRCGPVGRALLVVSCVVVVVELLLAPGWVQRRSLAFTGGDDGGGLPAAAFAAALDDALKRIDALNDEVDRRGVVRGYGRLADVIISKAHAAAGAPSGRDAQALTDVLNGPLRALFERQLQLLRERAADLYEEFMAERPNPYEAGEAAQKLLLEGAADLVRPGSDWSFEAARQDLMGSLSTSHGHDTKLVEAQGLQGQGKQVTIEVIRKLQEQSASIQREADNRGALPWNFKWQYFMDRSPLGFRGQYAQGRHIVEFLLMPDPRTKNWFFNILNKVGPMNLAVGFDMFL